MKWDHRGFACIGLDNPKDSFNVGAAMRAAGVYGAVFVATSGQSRKSATGDTMKAYRHLPLIHVHDLRSVVPHDCVAVAVDLLEDATPLPEYSHPERAFYVFGSENATLDETVLSWCRDKVYVPTNGCMNLAATVNVILYDRLAKARQRHGAATIANRQSFSDAEMKLAWKQ